LPDVVAAGITRLPSGIDSFDALLGGGFVPGSSILLIGPPGAGKSTLLLQLLHGASLRALYVTGEESVRQMKIRVDRLEINSPNISLLFETEISRILSHVGSPPIEILVIDSIQTVYTINSGTLPGSTTQIRKCAYLLRRAAQQNQIVLILVGQVTKEARAAGPRLLEHAVDMVLYLGFDEEHPGLRVLQASKNRFGSTVTSCAARMTEAGLAFSDIKTGTLTC
jgi:DNA repair protein RadA/Sms